MGNKGAIACVLRIHGTSLCFVSAHLEAHQQEVEGRNGDFKQIVEGLRLGRKDCDLLSQFDHTFFFGETLAPSQKDGSDLRFV